MENYKTFREHLNAQLQDDQFAIEYLNVCYSEYLKSGDIIDFLIGIDSINQARGGNNNKLANQSGLTRQHVGNICEGKSIPTIATLGKILEPLGIQINFVLKDAA